MSRPYTNDSVTRITVGGSGGYSSLREAVNQELPVASHYPVRFNLQTDLPNDHVVVPPYIAANANPNGSPIPIAINGNGHELGSITFTGGLGTCRVRDVTFTSSTTAGGVDEHDAHCSSYNTERVDLENCSSAGGAVRFFYVNGGIVAADGVDAGQNVIDEFVLCESLGRFMEFSGASSGRVNGDGYVLGEGIILANGDCNSTLEASGERFQPNAEGVGFIHNCCSNAAHGISGLE